MTELDLFNEFSVHFVNLKKDEGIALANFERELHNCKDFKKAISSRSGKRIARIAKNKNIYQWYRKTLSKYIGSCYY